MILVMHIKISVPDRKKVNADSCLTRQNPHSPPIFVSRKNKKNKRELYSARPNLYTHHQLFLILRYMGGGRYSGQ